MDQETKNYINQLTVRLHEIYQISVPITKVDMLVKQMGGTIAEEYGFDDLWEGTVKKLDQNHFQIRIYPDQEEIKRTFAILRNLGNLFLHMGFGTSPETWKWQIVGEYKRFPTSEQIFQANEFAVAFLMPKKLFLEKVEEFAVSDQMDLSLVAGCFHVTEAMARNRGRSLGILV